MILANTEIVRCLDEGLFSIKPLIHQGPGKPPFNTSAIDLHLGSRILIPKEDVPIQLDLRKKGTADFLLQHSEKVSLVKNQPYTLEKGKFVLANTLEFVSFPIIGENCYSARVEGRSSLARCGILVHFTAPTIHSGFEGTITLEITNLGVYEFLLSSGMAICQLIIEEVKGRPVDAPNQFKGQEKPEGVSRRA